MMFDTHRDDDTRSSQRYRVAYVSAPDKEYHGYHLLSYTTGEVFLGEPEVHLIHVR